ncbi:hypothetical protein BX666DRAFT_2113765 [Dichotomocladium elegans]|nr:hypothetical protein BX666DRAFT_2113765 [Dichotomocladium elegans]
MKLQDHQVESFRLRGYTIVEGVLSIDELEALYKEADTLINYMISENVDLTSQLGCIIEPLTCGFLDPPESDTYLIDQHSYRLRRHDIMDNDRVSRITLDRIAQYAAQLLGYPRIYLLNEQYIVKPPQTAGTSEFVWHKDSDYLHPSLQSIPTVACWIALDAVDKANGTLLLADPHENHPVVVQAPAGSVVFMSNRLNHKSTGNTTHRFRRVFMPQYGPQPLVMGGKPVGLAIECPCSLERVCSSVESQPKNGASLTTDAMEVSRSFSLTLENQWHAKGEEGEAKYNAVSECIDVYV